MNRGELKQALLDATGCDLQHDGWPCGTCFFAMEASREELTNADWQALLVFRGDYKETDCDNLPADREASLQKILRVAECEIASR